MRLFNKLIGANMRKAGKGECLERKGGKDWRWEWGGKRGAESEQWREVEGNGRGEEGGKGEGHSGFAHVARH